MKRRQLFSSLKSRKKLGLLFQNGKRTYGSRLMLRYLQENSESLPEIALAIPKKWGNAVKRNRLKRQFRAILDELLREHPLPFGMILAILPKLPAPEAPVPYDEWKKDMVRALRAGGWPAHFGQSTKSE